MTQPSSISPRVARAIDVLNRVLTEIGWKPVREAFDTAFHLEFGPTRMPVSSALAAIATHTEQFVFYVNFGVLVAADRRDEVARFITRANWGLLGGALELDFSDGHVRVRSAVDFDGIELNENLIRNVILGAMDTVETYADSLLDVALRGEAAEKAFERVTLGKWT